MSLAGQIDASPLILHKSTGWMIIPILFGAFFAVLGGLLLNAGEGTQLGQLEGWSCLIVGGLVLVFYSWHALFSAPPAALKFDAAGIEFLADGGTHMAWDSFDEVFIARIFTGFWLCLAPKDPLSLDAKLRSRISEHAGRPCLRFLLDDLRPRHTVVFAQLKRFLPTAHLIDR